jgi:hypothetical protein
MGRILGFVFCSLSLSAVAQMISTSTGTAIPIYGNYQLAPLLAPPNVALPGSGTPTGAPPALGVNDPRGNAVGAVYVPQSTLSVISGATGFTAPAIVMGGTASNAPAVNEAENNEADRQRPPTFAMNFVSDDRRVQRPKSASLGELAAQFRAKRPAPPKQGDRVYTNNDIYAMSNTASVRGRTMDLPQADSAKPESDVETPPQQQSPRMQGKDTNNDGVLDQRDLRAVEDALQRNAKKPR